MKSTRTRGGRYGPVSVLIACLIMLTLVVPSASAAAATPIVWVDSQVSSTWPVSYSVGVVDAQTYTDMQFGPCRTGVKCIIIREKTIYSAWAAVTYGVGTSRVTIYLNPQRRWYSWYAKRSIVTHELGHANGITWHNPYCTSIMYGRVFCPNGSLPPYRWTATELTALRRN